ncbi:DUF6264 family protein [Microbacterium sp. CIAB417]|uniref:DUF6264 family protein n=1 Tax=Microbacterium sp. CIAB417 TaxID=2860287 RepID=UPI001FAD53CD|nr:DUF6264 family protein [Microbacterium sp. CIAB417]
MSDERPRPQYGEYATPEEQRARIRQPDATFDLDAGKAPDAAPPAPAPNPAAGPVARNPRAMDRVATIALLALGLFEVLRSIPGFVDPNELLTQLLTQFGVDGGLSDAAGARAWGAAAAILLAVGWFATAAVSVWNLRAGRLSFWIPLVGGVVFTLLASVLLVVPLMSDPGLMQQIGGITPLPTPSAT